MAKGKKTTEQTLKRYLWLLGVLYDAGEEGLTLDELSSLWQTNALSGGEPLSLDTYNKHRAAIKEIFKIEIACNNGKRTIEFTPGKGIGAIRREMINAIAINNVVSSKSDLWLRIQYDDFEHEKKFMLPILEAISKKKMVVIDYADGADHKKCVFAPVLLKSIRQRWYLFGCEYEDDEYDPNVIPLDWIKKIRYADKRLDDYFGDVDSFVSEHYNLNLIPVSRSIPDYGVKLKVSGGLIEHIKLFPLHHTQIEFETSVGYSVFGYDLIPDENFIGEILKNGDRIEVVEPESLRDKVITRVKNMQNLYLGIK